MNTVIRWLEQSFGSLPLPLLEVWGRVAFILGAILAIAAYGGFTFKPGGRFGLGRERQAWDAKAILSIPVTFISIIVTGYLGSFVVLVPGAQTLESLKDLVVFLCVVLFGYPALLTVPFAYGLSDLIEGTPPSFLADWLPGYFINPACFWMAYQLFGKDPDFRRPRTWGAYLLFVIAFFAIEPALWGYICSSKFSSASSYRNISSALFFTTGLTWILAPAAMLVALPLARRTGMFWAEIPGHVKERLLGSKEWLWEASRDDTQKTPAGLTEGWPIRMVLLTPFIALVLLMTGATAYVALRSAERDANKLAARLHQEIADNIALRLDEYLQRTPPGAVDAAGIGAMLKQLPITQHGTALILDHEDHIIASSIEKSDAVEKQAIAALRETRGGSAARAGSLQFRFDHVTEKPLSRTTWLAQATAYGAPRLDWTVLTLMPESYYLAGIKTGNSRSAMVFAVALLLSVAVAAFLASLMTARLRQISLATQSLSRGDLAQRVPSTRLEELDALTRSWNDMAEQLSISIGRLRGEVETRKRREQALEESETRVQLAVRGAKLAIWDWDVQNDRLVWDDAMYRLYDVEKSEFGGAYSAWSSCLDAADFARATGDVQAALRGEREFNSEFRVRQKDGSLRVIRGIAQTLRDETSRPSRMVGINWDVTERLEAERALRESETFIRLAQEAAHVGSWQWDLSTNRFQWSLELSNIHGLHSDEFDGQLETVMSFWHPQDAPRLRELLQRIRAGEDVGGFECRIVRKDGKARDLWFIGRMERDERDAPTKFLGIAIDITERRRQELLRAAETRILGMIAAEMPLGEILAAIVASVEALSPGTIGSILLLSADGQHLRRGAAPGLPEAYNRAVESATIGPQAGSCGTAAYRGEPVTVVDIDSDPLWRDYRALAREHKLRACWSTPIKDARGKLLGTFAMYYREPHGPGTDERALIERATHLAGVAITRQLAQEQNRRLMHALGERVKELTCLHRTSEILQDFRLSMTDWLREIVNIMPPAWQYPEDTAARISLGNAEFKSRGFTITPWQQRAEFTSAAGQRGCVEVVYLREKPADAEGPFIVEERKLIDSLAEMLRSAIDARQAEEALRENEQRLREEKQFIDKLMDSLPGVVFLFKAHGRFIKWNHALEQVSGYSGVEIARLAMLDFVDADHGKTMKRAIESVLSNGQEALEIPLLTKARKTLPYYLNAVRLHTAEGLCVLGVGIDLSDRRRLEEQFRQAQKMEAVGSLAGGVAHDFNNLLTVILGYSELLKDGLGESDPRHADLEQIIATSRQASGLTRQLLAFSRKQMLQPVRFNLNHNIAEMQKMLRRIIGEDMTLNTHLHPTPIYCMADPGQVEQALLNLVMNARDAMPQGGTLTIETHVVTIDEAACRLHAQARPGQYVQIAVTDTGTGMTPEVKARLFEPFFTTKGVGKGTGLGLAMVYGTVQQSGGHVEVDSTLGHGSTFRLYFPLSKDALIESGELPPVAPIPHGNETVLLVEDEEALRNLAVRALTSFGYRVLSAKSGEEALQLMTTRGREVQLVVTDVIMPGMSGPSLAALLKQDYPQLPILFMSGHTDDAVLRHGLSHEQFEFLAKPYSPAGLSRKVRDMLDPLK